MEAFTEKGTWGDEGMIVNDALWKDQSYDACWWKITVANQSNWKQAKLIVNFTKI